MTPRAFTRIGRKANSFTLVEMLTAVAVLSLLVILVVQALTMAAQTTLTNNNQLNNLEKGRQALDRIGLDLASALPESDTTNTYFKTSGDDAMCFYSQVSTLDMAAGTRVLAAVDYTNSVFQLSRGVEPSATPSFGAGATPPDSLTDYQPIATGVIRFKLSFLDTNGVFSTSALPAGENAAAVIVTLVVIDDVTLTAINNNQATLGSAAINQLQAFASKFTTTDLASGQQYYDNWNGELATLSATTTSGISPRLLKAARVFQRTYYIR